MKKVNLISITRYICYQQIDILKRRIKQKKHMMYKNLTSYVNNTDNIDIHEKSKSSDKEQQFWSSNSQNQNHHKLTKTNTDLIVNHNHNHNHNCNNIIDQVMHHDVNHVNHDKDDHEIKYENNENTNHLYNIYCVYEKQYISKWDDDEMNLSLQQFSSDPSRDRVEDTSMNQESNITHSLNLYVDTGLVEMDNNDSNNSNSSSKACNINIGNCNINNNVSTTTTDKNKINHTRTHKKKVDNGVAYKYHPVREDEEDTPHDDDEEETINYGEHSGCDHHDKYIKIVTRSNSFNHDHDYNYRAHSVYTESKSTSSTDRLDIKIDPDIEFNVTQTLRGI